MKRIRSLLLPLVAVMLGLWIACRGVIAPDSTNKSRADLHIASSVDYAPAFDAFAARENIGGTCTSTSCDSTYYTWHPDCQLLNLQFWGGNSKCAMTTLLFDFDTRDLPDAAEITDAKLRLYWRETQIHPVSSQPNEPQCETFPPGGGLHAIMGLGSFFKAINITTGGDSLVPSKALPPIFCSSSEFSAAATGQDFRTSTPGSIPKWIDVDVNRLVSRTTFSRYVLDREDNVQGDSTLANFFEAIEHTGSNQPTLRVKYKMAYHACLDGEVSHGTVNCSSCSDADFTFNTAGQTATVSSDSTQTGMCGEGQMALVFDTSSLYEGHPMTTATLSLRVKTNSSLDVSTVRLRVYSKQATGNCPGSLSNGDFIGCGSGYTDLGLVTLSGTGEKTITIPNPSSNVNKTGLTKIVLVDASIFSSTAGSQATEIYTEDATTAAYRPVLTVTYD